MHERFMEIALEEAARARLAGEVPVGAVVVLSDVVVGRGHNAVLAFTDPSAHAEVLAVRAAAMHLGNYRLIGATLYCTVEPCLMCLGTAMHARISRVVYGAPDLKVGAIGRLAALRAGGADFNHRFESVGGVLADRAAGLLLDFFRERRAATRVQGAITSLKERGEVPKWS
jgi:tRNA(adenine34) deaminase